MNSGNLIVFVIPILVGFMLRYITLSSTADFRSGKGDELILKPHKLYGYLGIIGILALIFVYVMVIVTTPEPGWLVLNLILVIFLVIGMYLIAYGFFNKLIIRDNKIVSYSFWRKPISIEISEIKEMSFAQVGLSLELSDGKNSVDAHMHHVGFSSLITLLKNEHPDLIKVPLEKIEKAYGNITRGIYRKSDKSVF